ncbi:hypothetical protein C8R43DRAFT_32356 [Mycena crocata]|nr:hypothetical protein C8R43DRAFT_32356 [Mycena crocata]
MTLRLLRAVYCTILANFPLFHTPLGRAGRRLISYLRRVDCGGPCIRWPTQTAHSKTLLKCSSLRMLIPQSQLRVPPRLPLLGVLSTQFSLRSVRFGMLRAHAVHPLAVLLARVGPLLVLWTQTTPSLQPAPVNARRTKPRARLPKRNGRLLRTRLMLSPTPTPRTTPWMVAIPMWRITLHRMP